jgi:hypothetical protein
MNTKTYTELLDTIKSLCGVEFAAIELPRIANFVNRRAKRAYRASNNWPRFIVVGEARAVTTVGGKYVPYTEGVLDDISVFLRVQKVAPFTTPSPQDYNFHVDSKGANLITADTVFSGGVYVTYKKVLDDTYGDTTGTTSNVPSEWFDYIAHGVYADYLRAEGQQEKSQLADQESQLILQDELVNVDQQGMGMTFGSRFLINTAGNNTANNMLNAGSKG